ncbi:MAG: DegV family protein [Lachnospiraceae bacterium]|nr:DegV family protein [Lachnospiraceae bacterium]
MSEAKNIQIIIDSTTDLAEQYADRVLTAPLLVSFGDTSYLDGIDLTRNAFYEKLETGDVLPKTSQPSPAVFESLYQKVRENGMEGIVITLSSALSGTYQSACIAAADYPEISVIDSRNVAVGTGILVQYAIDCVQKGMSREALVKELEEKKNEICLVAMLDTLEYLMKGGRLSKTAAFAGTLLNIKPVITIKDGAVEVLGKARGIKKANNLLVELITQYGVEYSMPVLLGYSGTSDTLLKDYIAASSSLWEGRLSPLDYSQICSVIGTHAGPGAVAVAFFKSHQTA